MITKRTILVLGASVSVTMALCLAAGAGPSGSDSQAEFFETRVRPVLANRCGNCHGAIQQQGGLRVDSLAALVKGGKGGAALVPGKPEASRILQAISYSDLHLKMPPAGKLEDSQIEALTLWVKQGAHWPQSAKDANGDKPLWSIQPISKVAPPPVKNRKWVRNPIDAFVLSTLEKKEMAPAPPVGKRELLRRVTFDVIGLPPTREETSAFLSDPSPNAYEKVVDRLLASRRYGERWARYWLDLVRYADTNGYERDNEKPYSWKYRDYVIRSLNEDKPYDRFLTEQLAGDELPDRTEATIAATGFLRLGTWDDEPNDPLQYKYERLDDLVHASSTAFLGLTVRCARCHDHKFDPISQKDYYAFAGAFYAGYLDPADGKLMGGPPPARLKFPVLGFTDQGREAPPLKLLVNGDPRREADVVPPGYLSLLPSLQKSITPPPSGADTTLRRTQLARWMTDPRNPLTARVMVNRIWQHHFGQGIVRTPNNFGRKGSLPTHPELLDWLAAEFMNPTTDAHAKTQRRKEGQGQLTTETQRHREPLSACVGDGCMGEGKPDTRRKESKGAKKQTQAAARSFPPYQGGTEGGAVATAVGPNPKSKIQNPKSQAPWSVKRIHRLILLSNAYRMSSVHPLQDRYNQRDSGNELIWRFNRQRLDADALRDSILAVSGKLNLKEGGPGFVPTVTREALEGLSRKGAEWQPSPPEEQNRRTVYMFLKRALIMPLLTIFDFADTTQPLEQRDVSLVAPQALALLNNPFLQEQSEAFARRVEAECGSDRRKQAATAWRLALGREPSASELEASLGHMRSVEARERERAGSASGGATLAPHKKAVLWLRADEGVETNGQGRVTRWRDSAGRHTAVQTDEKAQPILAPNVLNGRPALRFDGQGRFLSLEGQVLASQQFTVVAVASDRAIGGGHREIFSNWNSNGNIAPAVFLGLTGTSNVRLTDFFAPAGTVRNPMDPFILTAVASAEDSRVYQDRTELARVANPLPKRNLNFPYVIGQQGNINGEFWNGDILEVQVYDHALSDAERTAVWDDLTKRYAIAVPPKPADPALVSLCHVLFNSNEFIYVD